MLFVLDLDDTLYLEQNYVKSGFAAVDQWISDQYQYNGFFNIAWELFLTGTRGNIFDKTLDTLELSENGLVGKLVSIYRTHIPDITLEQDAKTFINSKDRTSLAIITDGFPASQWAKIHALGLGEAFEQIVVTGDWGIEFWKPHPRAFQHVSEKMLPSQCIYIGDNPQKDFTAPQQLGWKPSIRIRRPKSLHYEIPTPDECIEISSFSELL